MKLDKIAFAKVIAYISNIVSREVIDNTDIQVLDDLIDVPIPELENIKTDPVLLDELIRKIVEGQYKIEAIKLYRQITGFGLKDAKDAVEKYWIGKTPDKTTQMISKLDAQLDDLYNHRASGEVFILDGLTTTQLIKVKEFIESFA